ncbi:MAG: hypothetical protein JAY97_08340 [Candidatus Thiodiazotropha sp. 'RUGA']|nr:hypothetical protein [Candidatus Thiodiazotropha sp. 'RUGA']
MTAQASDIFIYKDDHFNLVAYSNGEPFDPTSYGYSPVMASTACWRGYLCEYKIENGELLLDKLYINHQESDLPVLQKKQPPNLNGSVASVTKNKSFIGRWLFEDINMPLAYTGGLVVAQGFIRSLYVHMGFHPAWKYEEVHELVFESGHLISESDLSSRMVDVRKKAEGDTMQINGTPSKKEIEVWIAECFRRDYKR